jgi:imidazolonepropionase-like amidohydrolase
VRRPPSPASDGGTHPAAQVGLEPHDALAAASTWPRRFLGAAAAADIVTYHHDPREDPGQLAHPAAVVAGGSRPR